MLNLEQCKIWNVKQNPDVAKENRRTGYSRKTLRTKSNYSSQLYKVGP